MKLNLISLGFTNKNSTTLDHFTSRIRDLIKQNPGDSVFLLPEYCWGDISNSEFTTALDTLRDTLLPTQQAVLGTFPQMMQGQKQNVAIYVNGANEIRYIPKSHTLQEEQKRGNIVNGTNPGIIEFNGLKLGVVICADLWDTDIFREFLPQADLLLVPAMTTVLPDHGSYAKVQWFSLLITRSREYIVPIMVADHHEGSKDFDVGGVTAIVDPSWKSADMNGFSNFLVMAQNQIASYTVELQQIREYKEYRQEKGLYHY